MLGIAIVEFVVCRLQTGAMTIDVSNHPGFGWCCFDFGERGAAFLRDALVRHATGPAGPNLYAEIPNEPTPRH